MRVPPCLVLYYKRRNRNFKMGSATVPLYSLVDFIKYAGSVAQLNIPSPLLVVSLSASISRFVLLPFPYSYRTFFVILICVLFVSFLV